MVFRLIYKKNKLLRAGFTSKIFVDRLGGFGRTFFVLFIYVACVTFCANWLQRIRLKMLITFLK